MPITQNRGLRGLPGLNSISEEERQAFMLANEDKLKQYRRPGQKKRAAEILYNNQQFINQFGQDTFNKMNDGTQNSYDLRNTILKEKVVDDAFKEAYSPYADKATGTGKRDNKKGLGKDWETYYNDLSTDAKEKLLKSEWKTPEQMEKYNQEETWYGKAADYISDKGGVLGKVATFVPNLVNDTYKEARNEFRNASNQKILDNIYNDNADAASKSHGAEISQAYMNTDITGKNDDDTKRKFINAITPSSTNMGISEFASHYGNGSEDQITSEMEDFSIDEMRQILAKKAVYDATMSPQMAATALNNEAKRYIKDHQGSLKRFGLFAKDVGISALSYTADKVNGIYNLGLSAADKLSDWGLNSEKPTVYVDTRGNVIDPKNVVYDRNGKYVTKGEDGKFYPVHQEQLDRTTLHNMGKNLDGSEDESILNAQYWTRAEQFGTLDSDEQKQWEKLGSSPYKVAYNPNEDTDLWYESFKMASFGIADAASMFIPYGVGMAGRALSTASKAGKIVNGLGKGIDTASKYLTYSTRTGQVLQGGAGALGIAYAYNRGAFQETLAKNLADAEEANLNVSKNEVANLYQNDAQYRSQVDALVEARAAQMKADYMDNALQSGTQVEDTPELDATMRSRAQEAVMGEFAQQRAEERKGTQEYADLQQAAINEAGDAAVRSFLPEAIKYGLVNTLGYRKFLYTNPAGLSRKVSSAFKGMEEVTTSAGKKRLVAGASKFETAADKAKQFGKVAASQMWGGAWTNGTDDMMVDAAERTANDSFHRYLDAYENGESVADTYGLADGLYSYWKGLQNSLGQETTWNAALVGGLGSVVSASPNMANIAHLATKEGREAFKNEFQKRYVYETDENGFKQIKRDEKGNPVTEDISLSENWRERANYFIQNGVLNTYYGKKKSERDLQNHADYVNKFLDEHEDFEELDDLITSDIVNDNATNVMDKKTARFIHAFNTIKALEKLGNSENDPLTMSSVVQQHKDLIERAAKLGTEEESELSDEEKANLVTQYISNNKGLGESEYTTEVALQHIGENARKFLEVQQAYDEAEQHIQGMENSIGAPLVPSVRNRLKLSKSLDGHWRSRLGTMKDEIGDTSDAENKTTGIPLVLSYGSKKKAEEAVKAFDTVVGKQLEKKNEVLAEVQKKLELYNKAQQAVREAKTSDESYTAQVALKLAEASYNEAVERKMYQDDIINSLKEKKKQLEEGLGEWEKGSSRVLTADEIFALDPVTRARMMDPKIRHLYNAAQKKQIEKLEARLKLEKGNDSLQKIQDIATLTQNIAQNEDAYNRISRNPDAAALQFEKQKEKAAETAYNLINERNAQTLVNVIQEAEDGLKFHDDVDKKDIENVAFRMLRKHSPTLLDIIDKKEMLPQYQKQINDAKEWSKVTSDIAAVVSSLDVEDNIKDSIFKSIDGIVERSNNKNEIIQNLEDAVDNVGDADIASDIERVLSGLEKLNYQRDATVVENRKQRRAREEAARKKLEEENTRLEAEAKAAAEKSAQEAAEKAKVKAEEEKKVTTTPQATGPLNDLNLGEDTSEKAAAEQQPTKKDAEDALRNVGKQMKDAMTTSGDIEMMESLLELGQVAIDQAREAGVGEGIIKNIEGIRKGLQVKYNNSKRAADNAKVGTVEETAIESQEKKTEPKFNTTDVQDKKKARVISNGILIPSKEGDAETYTYGSHEGKKVFYPSASVAQLRVSAQQDSFFEKGHSTAAMKDAGGYVVYEPGEYKEENGGIVVTKKAKVGFYKTSPEELNNTESQQKEDSSVNDNAIKEEWFGKEEGSEAATELKEEGENFVAESPTLEEEAKALGAEEDVTVKDSEQLEDSDAANEQGQDIIDTKDNTLSGNAMAEYVADSLRSHILERKKGNRGKDDAMNKYFAWMDANGIKLQDIIDDELHQIIEAYADEEKPLKVKFMAVRRDNNATHDNDMKNHLMLVVDYNGMVKDIHQEDRGGVISVKDKKYLVIGVVGYGKDNAQNAERKRLRDVLFSPNRGNGYGIAVEGMGEFFKNNPSERFFVRDNIATEIIPGTLIPGYLVKQLKEDESSPYRTISDLLSDESRNPHKLGIGDLGWYIQELTKYIEVNTHGREVMKPSDKESNSGRAFVLVPASNGKLAPSYIKPITYPEMADDPRFGNSALRQRIERDIDALISPPSAENLPEKKKAMKDLQQIFYLDKDHNFILMYKDGSKVSLVKDGENREPFAQFNLNDGSFTREAFIEAFREMNPRINITAAVLRNPTTLKEYDEAGALQTDLGRLYTGGSAYSIYPVDMQGNMIVPADVENSVTWTKGNSEYRDSNRAQVAYQGKYYYFDKINNTFHEAQGSPAITDAALLEELKYNMQVMNLAPTEQTTDTNIYVLKEGEHPEIVKENRNSHKIEKMSEEEAKNYLTELEKKKAAEERAKAAEEENEKELDRSVERPALDLGIDYGINPETGELDVNQQETQEEEKKEVEEDSSVEHRDRDYYADKSIDESSQYKPTSTVQTFKQLSKNKKYKSRLLELISKMEGSPVKFDSKGKVNAVKPEAIEEYLKNKGVPLNNIGTSEADIEAWIHTYLICH